MQKEGKSHTPFLEGNSSLEKETHLSHPPGTHLGVEGLLLARLGLVV